MCVHLLLLTVSAVRLCASSSCCLTFPPVLDSTLEMRAKQSRVNVSPSSAKLPFTQDTVVEMELGQVLTG